MTASTVGTCKSPRRSSPHTDLFVRPEDGNFGQAMSVGIASQRRRQTEHYTPDTSLQKRPLLALPGLSQLKATRTTCLAIPSLHRLVPP